MAYLEKFTINGKSYDLADAQLREAFPQLQTSLDAMKITDTAAGERLVLQDSAADTLQGLRVYVSAKQEGEGVPSPQNIRPIFPIDTTVTVEVADNAEMDGAIRYESCQLPENMYGGYFDWGRGVFVQTHGYVVVDGSKGTITKNGTGGFYVNAIPLTEQSQTTTGALQHTGMCDSIVYGRDAGTRVVYCSVNNVWFKGMTEFATVEAFKGFLQAHPICIVYPLQTPIEHAIEKAPALNIKTLNPTTYMDSSGSGLEATYVASPKAYIDKKIQEAVNENL